MLSRPYASARLACAAAAFAALSAPSAFADPPLPNELVRFQFTGTLSASNQQFLPPTLTPQVGDPFVLSLAFWRSEAPYQKTVITTFPDTSPRGAYAEYLLINDRFYFGGQDFTSFDTHSALSIANSLLNFTATDQGYGVTGNAAIQPDFPAAWFSDIRNPLPGNQSSISFSAQGHFDYHYGQPGPSVSGTITGGSIEILGNSAAAFPVPEPATLALLLPFAAATLFRRRRIAPHPQI